MTNIRISVRVRCTKLVCPKHFPAKCTFLKCLKGSTSLTNSSTKGSHSSNSISPFCATTIATDFLSGAKSLPTNSGRAYTLALSLISLSGSFGYGGHGGGGVEIIYDWANDGKPGAGWVIIPYREYSVKPTAGFGGSVMFQQTYNFSPEAYQGRFWYAGAGITGPYGGPQAGFSATPRDWGGSGPFQDPYTIYAGWNWGSPGAFFTGNDQDYFAPLYQQYPRPDESEAN